LMTQLQLVSLTWLLEIAFICLAPVAALAAPPTRTQEIECAAEYTVQAGDWLSKLADKYLGDMLAYPAIVGATNQKSVTDGRFARITNPDLIEVGWVLCIPDSATLAILQADPLLALLPEEPVYWQPLPAAECKELGDAISHKLGVLATLTATSFYTDSIAGPEGIGCQITATGDSRVFQAEDALGIADEVDALLNAQGWSLDVDSQFGAEAFTYYSSDYTKNNALCRLQVEGRMSEDANCPPDAGFALCFHGLPPEQQVYTVRLTCARHLSSE
jgi:hypothetical protein